MKIRNKIYRAEYKSPHLYFNDKYNCWMNKKVDSVGFYPSDGWEEVKEFSEEEKLNQLRLVLSEWEPRDVVDMIIDEYKAKIDNENKE